VNDDSPEVLTALKAVRVASELCRQVRKDFVSAESILKDDQSPVTTADFASQAILCGMLKEEFPEDVIVAEEDSGELRKPERSNLLDRVTSYVRQWIPHASSREVCSWIDFGSRTVAGRYWALDPIDGTKGFLRNEQYVVALALVENGIVKIGILGCPNLYIDQKHPEGEKGCLFLAIRGKGAVLINRANERKDLKVSSVDIPSNASLTESVESDHGDHLVNQRLAWTLAISKPSLKMDSQAKYGILARGEAALYLRVPPVSIPPYYEKVWDHAAGSIIVEEAGGKVTDIDGQTLDFLSGITMGRNRGIFASNGVLHDLVLRTLTAIQTSDARLQRPD